EDAVDPSNEPPEDNPPASDLLNSEAVACFIRLVYDRFYQEFGGYFGSTIVAIFTDEPMLLGRSRETGIIPGTTDILGYVSDTLGYDFTPYLPALWDDNAPAAIRDDYLRAVEHRLEQTYYRQLYDWCEAHEIALTGHPAEPDAITHLRYFQMPGQDIVWRQIEPDQPSALAGRPSTQAKAASSTMLHQGRRRNANEFCGAYGLNLTFEEMEWLANWLLIRGCNLLIPHAFYYSVRGPRLYERPPDLGIHSTWWHGKADRFSAFALVCRRLCWLNTDSQPMIEIAILGEQHHLPWRAAGVCFEHQLDFNYLDAGDLLDTAVRDGNNCLHIADQCYRVLIVDGDRWSDLRPWLDDLAQHVPVIYWNDDAEACLEELQKVVSPAVQISPPAAGLRVRLVRKAGFDWYILFNETAPTITGELSFQSPGEKYWVDPGLNQLRPFSGRHRIEIPGHVLQIIIEPSR
ncbi:MAG TPA: hypothetical protein VHL11_24100, partial [Phototrophicaceae bacterium]|nr:hypothetical protein [Phototrophicaceae bacterium]